MSQIGILVVGNTGTGKSSIISLLSGKKTKIEHGSTRGTDKTSTIQSKYDENIYFIDTIGLQDQNLNWKDPELLKRSLQYLHYEQLHNIKIIFCIEGASAKQGLFTQIATFIGSLRVEKEFEDENVITSNPTLIEDEDEKEESTDQGMVNDTLNVWNSCLIIKKGTKRGIDPEDMDEFEGVMAAAIKNGADDSFNNLCHTYAFTCTDWMEAAKGSKVYKKLDEDEYEEFSSTDSSVFCICCHCCVTVLSSSYKQLSNGYYTLESAKVIIEKKLNALPTFELKFKNEVCSKCGANGDPRYIIAGCHTKSEYMHIKPLSCKHTNAIPVMST